MNNPVLFGSYAIMATGVAMLLLVGIGCFIAAGLYLVGLLVTGEYRLAFLAFLNVMVSGFIYVVFDRFSQPSA
jgi:hypothetical protein